VELWGFVPRFRAGIIGHHKASGQGFGISASLLIATIFSHTSFSQTIFNQTWSLRGVLHETYSSTLLVLVICVLFAGTALKASAQNKPTSLSDARAAVDANMGTADGKAYDEQFGAEFGQKHLAPLRQCKQTDGGDLTSFWMLFKLDKDGSVRELLLYPETKLGVCARGQLTKERFATVPPRMGYWVSVYMKLK
jgi:hypothetical protein